MMMMILRGLCRTSFEMRVCVTECNVIVQKTEELEVQNPLFDEDLLLERSNDNNVDNSSNDDQKSYTNNEDWKSASRVMSTGPYTGGTTKKSTT